MKPMLLINVSGEDRPGITSAVTGVLAKYDVVILDVGQSVIHDHLSLGILVGLPETGGVLEPLQAELLALDEPGLRIKTYAPQGRSEIHTLARSGYTHFNSAG
jgi:phosphoserine phosphatase